MVGNEDNSLGHIIKILTGKANLELAETILTGIKTEEITLLVDITIETVIQDISRTIKMEDA